MIGWVRERVDVVFELVVLGLRVEFRMVFVILLNIFKSGLR